MKTKDSRIQSKDKLLKQSQLACSFRKVTVSVTTTPMINIIDAGTTHFDTVRLNILQD